MDGTDMLKMMQQAFELSKAFGGGTNTGGGFDQVLSMLQLFGAEPQNPEQKSQESRQSGNDDRTQAIDRIKAAIPYIDYRYQRYMGTFVKLIEIQMMMEMYSKSTVSMFQGGGGDWRRAMLESLRPHLDNNKAGMINFLIAAIDLNDAACRMNRV